MSEEDPRFPDVGWSQGDDPWTVPSWLEPAKDVPAERPAPPPPAGVGSDARVPDDGPTTHFFFDDTALDPVPVSSPYPGGAPAGGALADGAPTPAARPGRPGPTVHPGSRPRLDDSAERRRLAVLAVGAFVAVALLAVLLRVVSGPDEKGPVTAQSPTMTTTPGGNLTATPPTDDGADAPPDATGDPLVDSGAADPAGLVASGDDTPQAGTPGTPGTAGAAGPGPAGRSASGSPTAGAPVAGGPALAPTPSGSPASNSRGESRSSTQVRTDGGPASARVSASGRSTQPSSGPTGGGGSAPTGPTGGGGGGGGGAPAPAPSGAKNSSSTGASSSNTSSSPGTPASG